MFRFVCFNFILVVFLAGSNATDELFVCDLSEPLSLAGECRLNDLSLLHPTQFRVGKYYVDHKIKKLEIKYVEGGLKKYLSKKVIPVHLGPDMKFYLSDRHHLSASLYFSEIPSQEKFVKLRILSNWTGRSMKEFYKFLVESKSVYLQETGFSFTKKIEKLPNSLRELKDDPYRSLSWLVREIEGYSKEDVFFLEFIWANYFYKKGIRLNSNDLEEFKIGLEKAKLLTTCKVSQNLPGCIE